jgi:hypothetical protein
MYLDEEEKDPNTFTRCCNLIKNPDFGKSISDLPKPMNDLILVLFQHLEKYFLSDVINFFRTEQGLELVKLLFWYCFIYMVGENVMKEKQENPRDALSLFLFYFFFFILLQVFLNENYKNRMLEILKKKKKENLQ